MRVIHLKSGWNDPDFESKVGNLITEMEQKGLHYRDIKISSKDNNTLLIFEGFEKK